MINQSNTPADFQLIETMLYTPGKDRPVDTLLYPAGPLRTKNKISDMDFALQKEHLMRMRKSAIHFKFSFPLQYARRSLSKKVKAYEQEQQTQRVLRVRLLLSENGAMKIEMFPIILPSEDQVIRYAISHQQLQSDDIFLQHKTTNRTLFDSEHERLNKECGCDEVLFFNEREEVCEGSRSNIFIQPPQDKSQQDKAQNDTSVPMLLTPPTSCGLLPGTLRGKLLKTKRAKEAVLTIDDLKAAEKIYFGNSVRGLQEAKLV